MTEGWESFPFVPSGRRTAPAVPQVVDGYMYTGGTSGVIETDLPLTFFSGVDPAINGFTITTARGTYPLVDVDGGTIIGVGSIAFSTAYPYIYVLQGESVTVSYDGSDYGAIRTPQGAPLAAFTNLALTNNSTLTAPTVVSVTVEADGYTVTVVFSDVIASDGSGWSFNTPSSVLTPNSTDPNSTWTFTSSTFVNPVDTPTYNYTPGDAALRDPAVPLAAVSGGPVINHSA